MSKNKDKVIGAFNRLLASVPYDDYAAAAEQSILNNGYQMKTRECLYRSSIFCFLQGCGVVVASEMHTNKGRPDLVIAFRGVIWVIELKVAYQGENATTKARAAYRQIIEMNYAAPYSGAVCIGMAIDDTVRQITKSVDN
jgi:hypothetical protein